MSSKPGTICVLIASYRDTELGPTIRNLFSQAADPGAIRVGVVYQSDLPSPPEMMHDRVRWVGYLPQDSKGCCWARSEAEKLWDGEEFMLQIDSHMRFVPYWDRHMLAQLEASGSVAPILTTRPLPYTTNPEVVEGDDYAFMTADGFENDGMLMIGGARASCHPMGLQPTAVLAAGFVFGPASRIADAPYDPLLYFRGEEVSMAVRYWTAGYDLFTPSRTMIYHRYNSDKSVVTHWVDQPKESREADAVSTNRTRWILGMSPATKPERLGVHGLGSARPLCAYEAFSGIKFSTRTISDDARRGFWPSR